MTSSPFQMLSNVNPDFTSNLSFKIANASVEDEKGSNAGEIDKQDFGNSDDNGDSDSSNVGFENDDDNGDSDSSNVGFENDDDNGDSDSSNVGFENDDDNG
ncbi:MAG: hypothetical protein ACM3VV_08660, partial [Deltaproteobacteria bacterium]